jgi:hypothetical protein
VYAGGRQTIRNVKYPLRHFANAIALLALLFVAAGSAYADNAPLCAPGNLASLIVTTCDIGEFQYTFTAFKSLNFVSSFGDLPAVQAGDFNFSPFVSPGGLSAGFTLTMIDPAVHPISATAPPGGSALSYFQLNFSITTTIPGAVIPIPLPSAPGLSSNGDSQTYADATIEIDTPDHSSDRSAVVGPSNIPSLFSFGPDFTSGAGFADVYVSAHDGGVASWDPTFTASLSQPPGTVTPEPSSLISFGTGLLVIGAAIRRRLI